MKKFKDRKVVKFLQDKGPGILGNVLDIAGEVTGIEALENIGERIKGDGAMSAEDKVAALDLLKEDMKAYEIEVRDRDSARNREIEMAKTNGSDWMMYVTGGVGLLAFITVIYAAIWVPSVQENKIFIHIVGMIEGVVIGNIFAYYFGTSKSSSDKNKIIDRLK